ncbi:ABC transporter ATP-binding protein [Lachnospiraceae bacterium]|jgi:ATP-binding cassette subfamily B protein|nr:ABC transporter ATP-binding protein [Lachnospiraceae bacterium]
MKKWMETVKSLLYSIKIVFKADKLRFLLSVIIQIVNTLLGYLLLYIGKCTIDTILYSISNDIEFEKAVFGVGKLVIVSFSISFCLIICNLKYEILLQKLQLQLGLYIDKEMSEQVLKLDMSYFDNSTFYDDIASALDGKSKINFLIYRVTFFCANILNIAIAVFIIYSWSLSPLIILLCIFIFPGVLIREKYVTEIYLYENKNRGLARKISYLISLIYEKYAAKEIRYYQISEWIVRKYKINWGSFLKGLKKIIYKLGIIDSLVNTLPEIVIGIVVSYLVWEIIEQKLSIGDFTYLLGIFSGLKDNILNLVGDLAKLEESKLAIRNYKKFMSFESKVIGERDINLESIFSIEFNNVSFKYPNTEKYILDQISFKIAGNEKIAIVGVNGAGKSTIIKLLLRFYEPDNGEIRINGEKIQNYRVDSLRARFSIIFQDFITYSLSIKENVIISDLKKENDEDEVWSALRYSGVLTYFKDKKITLETNVGKEYDDNGIELSGGNRQKLAIARAIFRKADFLIMDEPNSALDITAEKDLFDKIKILYKDKGIIMISHRLGNLDFVDKIYVVEKGKIIEEGSQSSLIKKRGKFYKLLSIQKNKKC